MKNITYCVEKELDELLDSGEVYLIPGAVKDSKKQFYTRQKSLVNQLQDLSLARYGADDVVFVSDNLSPVPGLRTVIAKKTMSCELIRFLDDFLKAFSPDYVIAITVFEDVYEGKTYLGRMFNSINEIYVEIRLKGIFEELILAECRDLFVV